MMLIGGLRVGVHSSDLALVSVSDPAYAEFPLDASEERLDVADLTVEVHGEAPPPAADDVVFDSGSPWIMHRDGDGYRIEFRRTDRVDPHTVVRCDSATSRADIYLKGARSAAGSEVPSPFRYPLDELLVMNHLSSRGGVIVHSAGLRLDVGGEQVGLVFPGASGAGKTTLSALLLGAGMGAGLLSDDRMILRTGDDGAISAWGTPWPGDGGFARNERVPLRSLLFLVQAESDAIVALSADEALRRLMPVVSCPWYDRQRFPAVLDTCGGIVEQTPCHEFRFSCSGAVVGVLSAHAAALGSS